MNVARAYAQALFEAAQEQRFSKDALDGLEAEFVDFIGTVFSSKEAVSALVAPITSYNEKILILREVTRVARFSPLFSSFLVLLVKKDRMTLIREVHRAFSAVRLVSEGGVSGDLVAADPMNRGDVEGLADAFSKKFGKKVSFRVSVDSTLLAGMKVTVNGVTYDGTLRSQLQRLRDRFILGYPQG